MSFLPQSVSLHTLLRSRLADATAGPSACSNTGADAADADIPRSAAGSFLADLPQRVPTIQLGPCEALFHLFSYLPNDTIQLQDKYSDLIFTCDELPRIVPGHRVLTQSLEELHAEVEAMQGRVFSPWDRGDAFIEIDRLHTHALSLQARISRLEQGRRAKLEESQRRFESSQNLPRDTVVKPEYLTDSSSPSSNESIVSADRQRTLRQRRREHEVRPHPPVREVRAEEAPPAPQPFVLTEDAAATLRRAVIKASKSVDGKLRVSNKEAYALADVIAAVGNQGARLNGPRHTAGLRQYVLEVSDVVDQAVDRLTAAQQETLRPFLQECLEEVGL